MRNLLLLPLIGLLTLTAYVLGQNSAALPPEIPHTIKLETPRVKVTQLDYAPGTPRPRSIRSTDQIIVFLDDCRYRRTDPITGQDTIRERKSGDAIWHDKGEDAPVLVNVGTKTFRTLVVSLK